MAWENPKTDWHSSFDGDGNYTGDHFNASDFNRIKNNLDYLRELASKMFDEFSIVSLASSFLILCESVLFIMVSSVSAPILTPR